MSNEGSPAETAPPKKRRVTKKAAPQRGNKTLAAALVACVLAAVDLYMTVRLGIKLF